MISKKQTFKLQILPPHWEKKFKKWVKAGVPLIIGIVILGIYAEVNKNDNGPFQLISKFFDSVIPILVLMAVFGNFGKFFKNINLTLQDQILIYKQKNKVKWKIPVKDITSIFEQVDPISKRIKTLFVTPQKNYELEYGIIDKAKLFSSIRMHNPTVHIKEVASSTMQELSSQTTSTDTSSTNNPEEILRKAILAVIVIGLLIYFFI